MEVARRERAREKIADLLVDAEVDAELVCRPSIESEGDAQGPGMGSGRKGGIGLAESLQTVSPIRKIPDEYAGRTNRGSGDRPVRSDVLGPLRGSAAVHLERLNLAALAGVRNGGLPGVVRHRAEDEPVARVVVVNGGGLVTLTRCIDRASIVTGEGVVVKRNHEDARVGHRGEIDGALAVHDQ